MKLRNALACTFAAFAVVGGATGTAQAADDDKATFDNSQRVASCDTVEILVQPNINPDDNNVDCSRNAIERDTKSVHIVGGPAGALLPLLPGQR